MLCIGNYRGRVLMEKLYPQEITRLCPGFIGMVVNLRIYHGYLKYLKRSELLHGIARCLDSVKGCFLWHGRWRHFPGFAGGKQDQSREGGQEIVEDVFHLHYGFSNGKMFTPET